MRATRAYIAGFGTAGSLVAGAAMIFVLASAVVAFRGWPQVSNANSPASIIFGKLPKATPSGVDRQLVAAASPRVSNGVPGTVVTAAPAKSAAHHAVGSRPEFAVGSSQTTGTVEHQSSSVTPPSQPSTPTNGCGSSCSSTPAPANPVATVVKTAGALGSTVTSVTGTLGSTVSGVAKVIAGKLGLSGGVGQTAAAAGSVLNGAGQLVTGAGKVVGGLLGGN